MIQKKQVLQGFLTLALLASCQGDVLDQTGRKQAITSLEKLQAACQDSNFAAPKDLTVDWDYSLGETTGHNHLVVSDKNGGYSYLLYEQSDGSSLTSKTESYTFLRDGVLYSAINSNDSKIYWRSAVDASFAFPYQNDTKGTFTKAEEIKKTLQGFSNQSPEKESYVFSSEGTFEIHYQMLGNDLSSLATPTSYDFCFANNLIRSLRVATSKDFSSMVYHQGVAEVLYPDLSTYQEAIS